MIKKISFFIFVIFCLSFSSGYCDTLPPQSKFLDNNVELMRQYLSPIDSYDKEEIKTMIVCGSNRIEVLVTAFCEFKKLYQKGKMFRNSVWKTFIRETNKEEK